MKILTMLSSKFHIDLEKNLDKIRNYKPLIIYGEYTPSAVLVPIMGEKIIFTLRSHKVKTHKGQISFPGGVIEKGEDIVSAALREAEEEIGIRKEDVEIIGLLDYTITITGYIISPVVGIVRRFEPKLSDEVQELLIFSFDELIKGFNEKDMVFEVNGKRIWGATARILKNLFDVLSLK